MGAARLVWVVGLSFVAALAGADGARAVGGSYDFDGGTPAEHATVVAALDASWFDWDVVPARITIRIRPGVDSDAVRGRITLDADLLDAGTFAWGVVQHEYAHQVDFFLFDESTRAFLLERLGGEAWCYDVQSLPHASYGCERFASTLAWAYWPARANCMRPTTPDDESAALPPRDFRGLVDGLLSQRAPRLQRGV
jgi:hypothetical protein